MADKSRLQDLLPYKPDTYLSDDEYSLVRSTFKGNDKLIKVLRKLLLPTAFDPELPIEEMSGDAWMVDRDFASISVEEVKTIVASRQEAIKFVLGGLIKLKVIANTESETPMEAAFRRQKDSAK